MRQAPGYEPLAGVGRRAYSHPETQGQDGWRAMAMTERAVAGVQMIGRTATRAASVTLLRQLVQRL